MKNIAVLFALALASQAFAQLPNLEKTYNTYKGIKLDNIKNLGELPNIQTKFILPALTYSDTYEARDESFAQRDVLVPALLKAEKYDEALARLEQFSELVRSDISNEPKLVNEIYSTYALDDSFLPYLDAFIKAKPDSYFSYLLRAAYYGGQLYKARTGSFAKDVKDEQWAKAKEFYTLADKDMKKSLSLNNKFTYTYLVKHFYEKHVTNDSFTKNLEPAAQLTPHSYYVWYSILEYSAPRWSGSKAMTGAALNNIKTYYSQNPKLKSLQSFAFKESGDQARFADNDQKAIEEYIKGFQIGYHQYISLEASRLLAARGDWKDACILIEDALDQAPYFTQALYDQAQCIKVKKRGIIHNK